jgi:hypothetical protein
MHWFVNNSIIPSIPREPLGAMLKFEIPYYQDEK